MSDTTAAAEAAPPEATPFAAANATDEQIVTWIKEAKVDEVLAEAGANAELAARLLAAETAATGDSPRKGVVKGLEKIITPPGTDTPVAALLLTLGGAPEEWHVIRGVGYVHPTIPSPVGGDHEPSLAVAQKLAADKGCAVELVQVTEKQAEDGRSARAAVRGDGVAAARELRRLGTKAANADVNAVQTEVAAAAGRE